jgi:ABC-type phosphate transport system permease subunit
MEERLQKPKKNSKAIIKAVILAAFIIGAFLLIRCTGIKDYLTPEALGDFLEAAGLWAPLVYIVIYVAGVCLFLPGTLLTGLGAALFGAMIGAGAAFFIGTLKDVWASGNWGELISFKVFFSIALFIFSFFIPRIIGKIKG